MLLFLCPGQGLGNLAECHISLLTIYGKLPTIFAMNIKERIVTFLKESGWSVNRLAKTAGVDQSSLSKALRDPRRGFNSRTIERIWLVLDGSQMPLREKE
jgi:hypothetical protein